MSGRKKIAPVMRIVSGLLCACVIALPSAAMPDWSPSVPSGFSVERIASVDGARELAFAPDGTLFVGTRGSAVVAIAHAESSGASPHAFADLGDAPAAGVAFANGAVYVGTQHAVWKIPYRPGDPHADGMPQKLAAVRGGSPPAGSDGDVHTTTSVAVHGSTIYASVGSSCNACVETDPTRATVGEVRDGRYVVIARRIRNAIALAVDARGDLWASDAGQDELPPGHPFEFIDDVGARPPVVDYGWPFCYENHKHKPGTNEKCDAVATARVVFPAYETPIGAVFYPREQRGRYAFGSRYTGGLFVTLHGSWHGPAQGLKGYLPPRVVFVPLRGESPQRSVDWNDPSLQWTQFAGGYQEGGTAARNGRPTGIAIGPEGSLFIADDQTGAVYRVRPSR